MASQLSPVFLNGGEFFMDSVNIVGLYTPNITLSFAKPVASSALNIGGYDWSQPYPGKHFDSNGHGVHLTVAREMPMNESVVSDSTSVLTSLTFNAPDLLMSNGAPVAMHNSWHVCRHIFISTTPAVKAAADAGKGCAALPDKCIADLKDSLTLNWGTAGEETMCSRLVYDPIPLSCKDTFGYSRQDVIDFNKTDILDKELGLLHTKANQQRFSWRIGTGYHSPGDKGAYATAAERTFLVATVWGYSRGMDPKAMRAPEVSFTCLSSGEAYVPPRPPISTSTSTTTTTTTTSSTTSATATPIPSDAAYYANFSKGFTEWTVYDGTFRPFQIFLLAGISEGGKALVKSNYADFVMEADITLPSGSSGDAGFVFRSGEPQKGSGSYPAYYAGLSTTGNVYLGLMTTGWTGIGTGKANVQATTQHHFKVRAVGDRIDVFVDDMLHPVISTRDSTYRSGMDGVRVFRTSARYSNVQILPHRFSDDFEAGSSLAWTAYSGSLDANRRSAALGSGSIALINNLQFGDFSYEVDVLLLGSSSDAGVLFRASNVPRGQDVYTGYYAGVHPDGTLVLWKSGGNTWDQLGNVAVAGFDAGKSQRLKVHARGSSISVFVNDMMAPKIQVQDATYKSGRLGLRTYHIAASYDNVDVFTM